MEKYFDLYSADFTIRCKMYFGGPEERCRQIMEGHVPSGSYFRHVILFCHGFAGHKDNAAAEKLAGRILAKHDDTALLIFNWPGHGDDEHAGITLADCDAYLSAVLDYIRDALHPQILDCCATSFGGYLILKYLSDHRESPFRRICLRCPAVVMYRVLTERILTPGELETIREGGIVPAGFDRKVLLDGAFLQSLFDQDIMVPDYRPFADKILIVQGTYDELIPFDAAVLFARKNHICMNAVEGADHRFLDPAKMEIVITSFMDFLNLS